MNNKIKRFIKLWESNINFIKERIKVQNTKGYNPYSLHTTYCGNVIEVKEKQYNEVDIMLEQQKIDQLKSKINFVD